MNRKLLVRDWMTEKLITITPQTTLTEAQQIMQKAFPDFEH